MPVYWQGSSPLGILATRDIEDVVALAPDCVLYMQEGFDLDDLTRLLSFGYQRHHHPQRVLLRRGDGSRPSGRASSRPAKQGGTSIHATGSSPGFSTTTMPLTLVYAMRRLDELTIDEYADIPASVGPDMIKTDGLRQPVDNTEMTREAGAARVGYQQSLTALADAIGLPLDGFDVRGDIARATEPYTLSDGSVIEKGTMAAQRITVAGLRNGKPFLTFRSHWFCTHISIRTGTSTARAGCSLPRATRRCRSASRTEGPTRATPNTSPATRASRL